MTTTDEVQEQVFTKLQDTQMKLKDLPLARGTIGTLLTVLAIKTKQLDADTVPKELTKFIDDIEEFYKEASFILDQDNEKSDALWNTVFLKWFPFQVGKNFPNYFVSNRWHFSAQIDELVATLHHRFRWWNRVLNDGFSINGGPKMLWPEFSEFQETLYEFVEKFPTPYEKEITLPNGNTRIFYTDLLTQQVRDAFELEERMPKPRTDDKRDANDGRRRNNRRNNGRNPRTFKQVIEPTVEEAEDAQVIESEEEHEPVIEEEEEQQDFVDELEHSDEIEATESDAE